MSDFAKTVVAVNATPPEIYAMNLPALSAMQQPMVNGPLVLELIIMEILDFFGVEWSPNQARDCSQLAYQEYYWFTIAELKQFVIRLKAGYFGKIYGKFSPAMLMEFMGTYSDEMWEARGEYFGRKRVEAPKDETPMTQEELDRQNQYFQKLIELAEKFVVKSDEDAANEAAARQRRMGEHIDYFKRNMTPEQLAEMDKRKAEIQTAAKQYELGLK